MKQFRHKIFTDLQGTVTRVGDTILYFTDGPCHHYGVVKDIDWKEQPWGNMGWSIKVLKTYNRGKIMKTPRTVYLTSPSLLVCGNMLWKPMCTVIEGT